MQKKSFSIFVIHICIIVCLLKLSRIEFCTKKSKFYRLFCNSGQNRFLIDKWSFLLIIDKASLIDKKSIFPHPYVASKFYFFFFFTSFVNSVTLLLKRSSLLGFSVTFYHRFLSSFFWRHLLNFPRFLIRHLQKHLHVKISKFEYLLG